MATPLKSVIVILCLIIISLPHAIYAQQDMVTVPDVTGLSVPEAAALLNENSINLGTEKVVFWTDASTLPKNKISNQSVLPGQQVGKGTTVDVTVVRQANITLLYDYNVLTIVNKSGSALSLQDITFNTFSGNAWGRKEIDDGQCAQISAVRQTKAQDVTDCTGVQTWFWTGKTSDQFWRSADTTAQFTFTKGGTQYASCNAANESSAPMRCDIYDPDLNQDELVSYVYIAYNSDQLIIRNRSKDKWLPLAGVTLVPGATKLAIGDSKLYTSLAPAGQVNRLAPGQCLWFTNSDPQVTAPVQPCDVIARLDMQATLIFWSADFGVDGVLDNKTHICPKATPDKLTLCLMPR